MADEFQNGICNGNWWNSPRNGLSLPCSTPMSDIGSYGWPNETVETKTRSCEESVSVSGSSMVYQDISKSQGSESGSGGSGGGGVLMDSTLQMMGYGLSSPSLDWNQSLLNRSSGRAENTFHSMLHQEDSSSRPSYVQGNTIKSAQIPKDWSPKNLSCISGDPPLHTFKQINHGLSLDHNRLNTNNSSDACTVTCQGLPTSFSMDSSGSYGYPSLLQGLFEPDFQPQQSQYDNRTTNYPSQGNYGMNISEPSPPWQKFPQFFKTSPPKHQQGNQLNFSNNTHFWSASPTSITSVGSSFSSSQNQFLAPTYEAKPNCSSFTVKPKAELVRDSSSVVKKGSTEPALKKPRMETPSPLPTFKVRKEKLGDRITALQQLVSPFGKTDTASVLFEAIEYIKFLHEQVSVLSAPYMKNGAPIHQQQKSDKLKDIEGPQQDLRSRGLCLVPISSTYPVTNETTADFWTPTFGGTYR